MGVPSPSHKGLRGVGLAPIQVACNSHTGLWPSQRDQPDWSSIHTQLIRCLPLPGPPTISKRIRLGEMAHWHLTCRWHQLRTCGISKQKRGNGSNGNCTSKRVRSRYQRGLCRTGKPPRISWRGRRVSSMRYSRFVRQQKLWRDDSRFHKRVYCDCCETLLDAIKRWHSFG